MKVKILGTELIDATIEFVSLVKRGANMSPFRIIKAEDMESDEITSETEENKISWWKTAGKLLNEGGNAPESDESLTKVGISAIFVKKNAIEKAYPILEAHGFSVSRENIEVEDDVIMLKLDGFTGVGSLIALTSEVGIATDSVVKFFDPFLASTDFNENAGTAFFPSLGIAQDALNETIFNVLQSAGSDDDAAAGIKKALSAFAKHVNRLAKTLPSEVFKLEKSLRKEFEGITLEERNDSDSVQDKDTNMTDELKKEAFAGDLDGLDTEEVSKDETLSAEDTSATEKEVEKDEPEIEVKFGTRKVLSETGEVQEQEYKFQLDAEGNEVFVGIVAKEEEETTSEEETAETEVEKEELDSGEINAASEATDVEGDDKFTQLLGAIKTLADVVKGQVEELNEVSKTAAEAKKIAEGIVVIDGLDDLDEGFAVSENAANRTVKKGESLWDGLMSDLD